ncbi:hypothetical protein ABZY44_37455, partial [Streptomyces sp. NPDC006544]|uniref:hypothetical protein n=1 Tax=Streptomyces sp. NPDC006544 TaxID=3154583 RepID=UPI0033AA9E83
MPDRRQPDPSTDDNPFAAPPEGRPDQPWEPRAGGDGDSGGGSGQGPGGTPGSGPARWDPTDPIQRRARYALLAGMWGFFFGVFGIPSVGLLLGVLALYWGISALRGVPVKPAPADGSTGSGGPDGPGDGTGAAAAAVRAMASRSQLMVAVSAKAGARA